MKVLALLVSSILIFSFSIVGWAEDMHMHPEAIYQQGEAAEKETVESDAELLEEEIIDVSNKICPVRGEPVDKNVSYVYKGKRYYFCCAMCVDTFKADPEKYIEKLQEIETKELGGHKSSSEEGHKDSHMH